MNDIVDRSEIFPNLICPGAPKAGTTTLFKILERHPDIYFSHKKEINYFNMHYRRGPSWYGEYFKESESFRYRCDFTTGYLVDPDAPGRMSRDLGKDVRFIIMLRNPVDRAYSHFQMLKSMFRSNSDSLADILDKDEGARSSDEKKLIDSGFYSRNIKRYLEFFPLENIHFLFFEDFITDMEGEVKKLLGFLGLESPETMSLNEWANKSSMPKSKTLARVYYRLEKALPVFLLDRIPVKFKLSVKKAMKRVMLQGVEVKTEKDGRTNGRLLEMYEDDIMQTQAVTGRDLSFWINKYKN